jgi:hypothetical protein
MKKIILSGFIAGIALLLLSILGLYLTIWLFPGIAMQYFHPAYDTQSERLVLYYLSPFLISFVMSWFWQRFKTLLTDSFLTRGIELGLIYVLIAPLPMIWLTFSSMHVSLEMAASWLVLSLIQGIAAGLIFEKINP